jgi:hypothetical protein
VRSRVLFKPLIVRISVARRLLVGERQELSAAI